MEKWTDVKDGIYEFDPVIYPTRLWVGKKVDIEKAAEQLYFLDEDGNIVDNIVEQTIQKTKTTSIATTSQVIHKESGWYGCIVNIQRPKDTASGVIAHEATHVCDWLCEELGMDGCNTFFTGEPRAYFVQWVADCIETVLKRK